MFSVTFIHLPIAIYSNSFLPVSLDTARTVTAGVEELNALLAHVSPSQMHLMGLVRCTPVPQPRVPCWQLRGQTCCQALCVEGQDVLFNQIMLISHPAESSYSTAWDLSPEDRDAPCHQMWLVFYGLIEKAFCAIWSSIALQKFFMPLKLSPHNCNTYPLSTRY